MEQSKLFDMFKAFDLIESSHKSDFFLLKKTYFNLIWSELPYNISTMVLLRIRLLYDQEFSSIFI